MPLPFCLVLYACTVFKLLNSTGNNVRISGGKIVTRYTFLQDTLDLLAGDAALSKSEDGMVAPFDPVGCDG